MFCYKILEHLERPCGGNGIWFGKSRAEGVKKVGKGMIAGGTALHKGKANCVRQDMACVLLWLQPGVDGGK